MCRFNHDVVENELFQVGDIVFCNLTDQRYDTDDNLIKAQSTLIKTRPVLIIKVMKYVCVVLPIKTDHHTGVNLEGDYYPIEYEVGRESLICLDFITTVDKRQLSNQRVCKLRDDAVKDILSKLGTSISIPVATNEDPAKDLIYDYIINTYGNIEAFKKSEAEKAEKKNVTKNVTDASKNGSRGSYRKTIKFNDVDDKTKADVVEFSRNNSMRDTSLKFNISIHTTNAIIEEAENKFNEEFKAFARTYIVQESSSKFIVTFDLLGKFLNYCKNKNVVIARSFTNSLSDSMDETLAKRSPAYENKGDKLYGLKFKF